jgi:hypothetical protein
VLFSLDRTFDVAVLTVGISNEPDSKVVPSVLGTELSLDVDPPQPGKPNYQHQPRGRALVELAGTVLFPSPACLCSARTHGVKYHDDNDDDNEQRATPPEIPHPLRQHSRVHLLHQHLVDALGKQLGRTGPVAEHQARHATRRRVLQPHRAALHPDANDSLTGGEGATGNVGAQRGWGRGGPEVHHG